MRNDESAVIQAFLTVNMDKFALLTDEKKDIQRFLAPPPNSVEEIAKRYALRGLNQSGRYTGRDIELAIRDAAAALNRKLGTRWSQGTVDKVAPEAATKIRKDFRTKPEKVAATYNAILGIPDAYAAFIEMEGLQQGTTIHSRQVNQAWALKRKCGVYPFC